MVQGEIEDLERVDKRGGVKVSEPPTGVKRMNPLTK